jgi:hypothetical protein
MGDAYTKYGIYGKCLEIFLGNNEENQLARYRPR